VLFHYHQILSEKFLHKVRMWKIPMLPQIHSVECSGTKTTLNATGWDAARRGAGRAGAGWTAGRGRGATKGARFFMGAGAGG